MAFDPAALGVFHLQRRWGRILVSPVVGALLLFGLYPTVYLVLLSLSRSTLGQPFQGWVGLSNYLQGFADAAFRQSLWLSVGFSALVCWSEMVLGVFLAVLLDSVRPRGVFRALMLLPLMTPPAMVAVVWRLLLAPQGGLLNAVLASLGLVQQPVAFLGSTPLAFFSIVVADIWQWTPFIVLFTYAALQAQPQEAQEAAIVDGARPWQTFRFVTLPLVLPALLGVGLLRLVMAFKTFDLIFLLTAGGPGFDTSVAAFRIYRVGLQEFDVGSAAALTVVFALLVGVVTLPATLLRNHVLKRTT